MPNYRRPFVAGGTFFFTVVTHERQPILTSKIARDCLRKTLQLERSKRPFTIDALVFLPITFTAFGLFPVMTATSLCVGTGLKHLSLKNICRPRVLKVIFPKVA